MTKQTEQHEQEFIDAWLEAERVPNHEYRLPDHEGEALEPGIGKVILNEWCDMGTYLERE